MNERVKNFLIALVLAALIGLMFADAVLFPAQPEKGKAWTTIGKDKPTTSSAPMPSTTANQ